MRQGKADFDVCNGHRNKRLTKTCFYLSEHVRRLYDSCHRFESYKDYKDVLKHPESDDLVIHSISPADKSGGNFAHIFHCSISCTMDEQSQH